MHLIGGVELLPSSESINEAKALKKATLVKVKVFYGLVGIVQVGAGGCISTEQVTALL